jgi:hypothetical protein
MNGQRRVRGERLSIVVPFLKRKGEATLREIAAEVDKKVGPVPPSSVRSQMNSDMPGLYERIVRGRYRFAKED